MKAARKTLSLVMLLVGVVLLAFWLAGVLPPLLSVGLGLIAAAWFIAPWDQ